MKWKKTSYFRNISIRAHVESSTTILNRIRTRNLEIGECALQPNYKLRDTLIKILCASLIFMCSLAINSFIEMIIYYNTVCILFCQSINKIMFQILMNAVVISTEGFVRTELVWILWGVSIVRVPLATLANSAIKLRIKTHNMTCSSMPPVTRVYIYVKSFKLELHLCIRL